MSDRISQGYRPEFDIDIERGKQSELFVLGILEAIKEGGRYVEVKRDDRSQDTGNVYVEYECRSQVSGEYKPSGIATTQSHITAIVLEQGNLLVCISTERLKQLARAAIKRGRVAEEKDGRNPTRGALVRITDLLLAGTKAVRASLLPKYGNGAA